MSATPAEEREVHTRLLRYTLGVEESRAYWRRAPLTSPEDQPQRARIALQAFEERWFGAKSQRRVRVVLANLRARFDAFPDAFTALKGWSSIGQDERSLVCHWHTQLTDPLYRRFTGVHLDELRAGSQPSTDRAAVARWVEREQPGRWNAATRTKFASTLLTAAHEAGLVATTRDPRRLVYPRVPDAALSYLLYLLRSVRIEGSLLENPYLASVGLTGAVLDDRLRSLPGIRFRRMGSLTDFTWSSPDLPAWAEMLS